MKMDITFLPLELIIIICEKLPLRDIFVFAATCTKYWNDLQKKNGSLSKFIVSPIVKKLYSKNISPWLKFPVGLKMKTPFQTTKKMGIYYNHKKWKYLRTRSCRNILSCSRSIIRGKMRYRTIHLRKLSYLLEEIEKGNLSLLDSMNVSLPKDDSTLQKIIFGD